MRALGAVLAVAAILLLSAQPATAQPDMSQVIAQLQQNQVVRLPGAVATVDESRLRSDDRVLLAPRAGLPVDLSALWEWASRARVEVTVVEGLWIGPDWDEPLGKADTNTVRRVLATHDVTDVVLGRQSPEPEIVPATSAQLDQLAVARPRAGVRAARAPEPYVDYADGLAARFPGELVVVAHGDWLEFAGPGADRAAYQRDLAYGPVLLQRYRSADVLDDVLDRMVEAPERPVYDPPRPPRPFNLAVVAAPYLALATVVATGGVWLLLRYTQRRDRMLVAQGVREETHVRLGELGARLINLDEHDRADPRVAERYATARLLFDQAHTPEAVAAVRAIVEEGLALSTGREGQR